MNVRGRSTILHARGVTKGLFEYRLFAENWKLIAENTVIK